MNENKVFKLTDRCGGVHYYRPGEDRTLARFVQGIKLNAKYDEWLNVYEDILLQEQAAVRLADIYLVQEIGGVGCD